MSYTGTKVSGKDVGTVTLGARQIVDIEVQVRPLDGYHDSGDLAAIDYSRAEFHLRLNGTTISRLSYGRMVRLGLIAA